LSCQVKIGILGGGFGLYGYMPACIQNGWEVHTLSRYKKEIFSRPELSDIVETLHFHSIESVLISEVDSLVCARNPESQIKLVSTVQGFRGHLYLEKPLAPTIELHEEALKMLELGSLQFSVGYLFPYTEWYKEIVSAYKGNQITGVEIRWDFKPTGALWKSKPALGGGIADFYAIHFISLFSDLNISLDKLRFHYDQDQLEILSQANAEFKINIRISKAEENRFYILTLNMTGILGNRFESISPFGASLVRGVSDARIPYLAQYLSQALAEPDSTKSVKTERQAIGYRKFALTGRKMQDQIL